MNKIKIIINKPTEVIDIKKSFIKHLKSFLKDYNVKFIDIESIYLNYDFSPCASGEIILKNKKIIPIYLVLDWEQILQELFEY